MPLIQASLPQPQTLPAPAAEVALAQLARAALGLVQAAGQPVPAVVVGAAPGGLTQLQIGEMMLAVRLSAPLAAGTAVTLTIATDGKGQPNLQVTPAVPGGATSPARPAVSVAPPPTPVQTVPQDVEVARPVALPEAQAPMPKTPMAGSQVLQTSAPAAVPAGAAANAPSATLPATAAAMPPPSSQAAPAAAAINLADSAQTAARPATPAMVTAAGQTPTTLTTTVGPSPQGVAAVSPAPAAEVPMPPADVLNTTAGPMSAPRIVAPGTEVPSAKSGVAPAVPAMQSAATPVSGGPLPAPSVHTMPQMSAALIGPPPIATNSSPPTAQIATPQPVASAQLTATGGEAVAQRPAPSGPVAVPVAMSETPAAPVRPHAGAAMAIPYRATPSGPPPAPAPSPPLAQVLGDPAQAAARQDSIVPLLVRLAALGPQLNALPPQAAQAVVRLLALRLEAGGLDGKALQGAVNAAGVLARPAVGTAATAPTMKSALLQLRSGLSGVPGAEIEAVQAAEIEAVQAVAGRPHPPVKGDDARAVRAELPLPMSDEDPARGLLGQTDAALSRLKLLQYASQPPEVRPGTAAQQELRVEVPLMIGAETALVQLLVDREPRRREQPGQRGWRMRFAFASRQTGEVGAEVGLFGPSVSVALWADTPEMEARLTHGLDELRAALVAEGLEAGSIRVRRREAVRPQNPGALMDSAR